MPEQTVDPVPAAVRRAMWRLLPFLGLCYLLNYVDRVAAMCVCAAGVFAAIPVIWQLPPTFLTGVGAAAGIALINSFGNLSGFVGPYLTGWLQDLTGDFRAGMLVVAGFMVLAGVVVLCVGRHADIATTTGVR